MAFVPDVLRPGRRFDPRRSVAALLAALVLGAVASQTHAATVLVTSLADGGAGSLRAAIASANANDDVVFAPGLEGTIALGSPLVLTRNVSIFGNPGIVLDGNDATRVLTINAGVQVLLDWLVIQRGLSADGGGINSSGVLTLSECVVRDNHATARGGGVFIGAGRYVMLDSTVADNESTGEGGGIEDLGTAASTITNSHVTGNTSGTSGAGIRHVSGQPLTIAFSTISGNQVASPAATTGGGISSQSAMLNISYSSITANKGFFGGGLLVQNLGTPATLNLSNSLVAGNTGSSDGGGVFVFGATANITNTTIAHNLAGTGTGGGMSIQNSASGTATVALTHASVAFNRSATNGGGITLITGALTLKNSLIAGNAAAANPDLQAAFTSQGFNLVQARGTSSGYVANDVPGGSDPLLANLAFNGGPTNTVRPQTGSPAINAINAAGCAGITVDQRGWSRPTSACDIGAYEAEGAPRPDALFDDDFE